MEIYIETERLILREILPTDELGFFELTVTQRYINI